MKEKLKILFVCLGNICRSPAAEGAFLKILKDHNLTEFFEVDSCGTSGYHDGELPDVRTRKAANKRGIQLTHKSRKIRKLDLQYFDYILVMDSQNFREVISLTNTNEEQSKIHYFRKFQNGQNGKEIQIPDPYYENDPFFDELQIILEETSFGFLKNLGYELNER
ncbi:low molecular weight phosphotyrosine protein phosphatase [Leptospira sp. 96542]|nr:low molecular weight phosphotyrosine protein phosphatase [Leptospira sp. 96542]